MMQYQVILLDHSDDDDKADDNGEGMTMMMMIAIRGSCRVCPTCVNKYLRGGGGLSGKCRPVISGTMTTIYVPADNNPTSPPSIAALTRNKDTEITGGGS